LVNAVAKGVEAVLVLAADYGHEGVSHARAGCDRICAVDLLAVGTAMDRRTAGPSIEGSHRLLNLRSTAAVLRIEEVDADG
jgi:hypothetical protein